MLARYFLRAALICCALFACVQPASATGFVSKINVTSVICSVQPTYTVNTFTVTRSTEAICISDLSHQVASNFWDNTVVGLCMNITRYGSTICNPISVVSDGNCPANSVLEGSACACDGILAPNSAGTACEMNASSCPAPTVLNYDSTACRTPAFEGSSSLIICTSDGNCSSNTYTTKQAACDSFSIGGEVPILTGDICEYKTRYSDGSIITRHAAILDTAICAVGDTACIAATTTTNEFAKNTASTSTKTALDTSTQVAAYSAAIAAGSTAAEATVLSQSATAQQAAARITLNAVSENGTGSNSTESVTIADDVALGSNTINVAITPVSVGGSGSCPAPSVMVLHGHTYYFTWTTYCNFANLIRPILLAFAWLAAAGILVGGFVV